MAEPAQDPHKDYEPDIRPDIRPHLRALEGGGENSDPKRGHLGVAPDQDKEQGEPGLYNPSGDSEATGEGSSAASIDRLRNAENSSGEDSLYNAEGDRQGRLSQFKGKARGLAGNKWLMGGVLGGSSLIALIVLALIIIAGAYKVVDFAEHVAVYQFARVTRQMSESADTVIAEKIGIDAADNSLYGRIRARYGSASGKVSDTWSKLDKYRPQKSIDNLKGSGELKFNYENRRVLPGQTLKSVSIAGNEVGIIRGSPKNFIPGYKFTNNISFSRDFAPAFNDALKANEVGPIVRGVAASQIRKELGISLLAWSIGKYSGKPASEADGMIEQEALAVAEGSDSPTNPNVPDKVNQAAQDAKNAQDASVKDPAKLKDIVNSGGQLPQDVIDSVNKSFTQALFGSVESFISGIVGLINPVFKFATPLCLVYDGSLSRSGPTINNNNKQLQRSAVWVQSAASQEKDGYYSGGEAVGATDWKLGDVSTSNAERRASGLPVDTSSYASTQASPTGEYSIADYGLGSTLGGIVDSMAGPICPVATNIWVGLGLGAATVFLTTGASATTDGAVDAATQTLSSRIFDRLISTAGAGKDAIKSVFSKDTLKTAGVIGAGTLVAKLLVLSQMSATHSSLATGDSYNNDVDSGTNIYANQVEQRQFYGAPMSDSELNQDNTANQKGLALKASRESAFTRYLAVANPDSLLSKTAIMTSGYAKGSIFSSLLHISNGILSPVQSLGSLLTPLFGHTALAAGSITSKNTYYGNVQFGYTAEEEGLMHDKNLTYGDVLENQAALDASGKEDEINSKYGKCFDGSESIGDMLANGDVKRDQNGNVLADDSLCSPKSLGPQNPVYGDLIFRWRLAHNYSNSLDQLTCEQDVGSACDASSDTSSSSSSNSGAVTGVSGTSQQLAQQILSSKNVDLSCLSSSVQQDMQDAAAGKPGTAGAPISSAILKLIATVAQSHRVCITAIESNGQGHSSGSLHYSGDAVDFGSLDGATITGRNAPAITIVDVATKVLPSGSAIGQSGCSGGLPTLPAGWSAFPDTCNHLHVQVPRGTP